MKEILVCGIAVSTSPEAVCLLGAQKLFSFKCSLQMTVHKQISNLLYDTDIHTHNLWIKDSGVCGVHFHALTVGMRLSQLLTDV